MNTYNELGIKVTKTLDDLSMIVTSNLLSRINTMKVSGMAASEVRKVLVADLIAGGRIFGQLRNGVKGISKNAIEEAGNIAAQKAFEQQGLKQYKWISVGKNVCPDCKPRHGTTGDLEYFKAIGMPKSEFSVCGLNCNCMLVPIEYEGEDLSEPIKYKKPSPTDIKMGGKHKTIGEAEKWLEKNCNTKTIIGLNRLDINSVNILTRELRRHKKQGFDITLPRIKVFKHKNREIASIESYFSRNDLSISYETQALQINLHYFGKGDEYFRTVWGKKYNTVNHFAENTNNGFKYIINHELGHLFHLKHINQYKKRFGVYTEQGKKLQALHKQYLKEIDKLSAIHKKKYDDWVEHFFDYQDNTYKKVNWISGNESGFYTTWDKLSYNKEVYGNIYISDYAKENLNEFIAECFAQVNNSNNPSPYAQRVYNILTGVE